MEHSSAPPRAVTEAMRGQFFSSFQMLETLAQVCPDEVWRAYFNGLPFWYHAWHTAYFFDYWFRGDYAREPEFVVAWDTRIPPEFESDVGPELFVPRGEFLLHLAMLKQKVTGFFDAMDDGRLAAPAGSECFTVADAVMGQIRHAMFNIGYLDGILRSLCLEESEWYAYNEDE